MNQILDKKHLPYGGKEKAIENMGGLLSLYEKHLSIFRRQYSDSDKLLQHMVLNGHMDDAFILIHSIKGLTGTLGLTRLHHASSLLEASIKKHQVCYAELKLYSQCLCEICE